MYPATPVRMVHVVGKRYEATVLWSGCGGATGSHAARRPITAEQWETRDYRHPWDGACETCAQSIPWDAKEPCDCGNDNCPDYRPVVRWAAGERSVFDTPSGDVGPGDMFYADWNLPTETRKHYCAIPAWSNCDGRHLIVVLPNGHHWDIDSRASNCTMREDTTHRCWIRTGEPPNVTAGKSGHTCTAGAGSILSGDYHGFLTDGVLTAG